MLALACSSESANNSSGSQTCKRLCDTIDSATCPAENKSDCLDVCATSDERCPSARDAFAACIDQNPPTTCDSNGHAEFTGCDKEWRAVLPCNICIVQQTDTASQKCLKDNCCPELQDAYSRADILEYVDCLNQCAGADLCATQCASSYPETAVKFSAVQACQGNSNCS